MEDILNQVESIDEAIERLKQKLEQNNKLREPLNDFVIDTVDEAVKDIESNLTHKLENYASRDALEKLRKQIETNFDKRLKPLATADSVSVVKKELEVLTKNLDKLVTKESHQSLIKKLEVSITNVNKSIESVKSDLTGQMVSLAEKQDLDKLYKRIVQEYDGKIKLLVPIETLNKKTEEQDNTKMMLLLSKNKLMRPFLNSVVSKKLPLFWRHLY